MNSVFIYGLTSTFAYLVGAIPFGYLIARGRGVDILHQGSGNIGATNVGRVLGRRFGILVFLLDFAKGAMPTALALALPGWLDLPIPPEHLGVAAGLAAFLGHLFPVYLRFHGGKGVATGAGVVAVLLPGPALAALVTWLVVVTATRYVSLASLIAAAVMVLGRLFGSTQPFSPANRVVTGFTLVVAILVFYRHRSNVLRLAQGTENRIKDSLTMQTLGKGLHVLALGLWFGSGVFFTFIAAPLIFRSFESLASQSPPAGLTWLPSPFERAQGSQLAGLAVGPIFPPYYLLQAVCGAVALVTAWSWFGRADATSVDRWRFFLLAAALVGVAGGWPLSQKVSDLRALRDAADAASVAALRAEFATWHLYSLGLNMLTILLVGIALALAARLPGPSPVIEKS